MNEDGHMFFLTYTLKTGFDKKKQSNKLKESLEKIKQSPYWKKFFVCGFQSLHIKQTKNNMFFLTYTLKTGFDKKKQSNKLKESLETIKQSPYWKKFFVCGFQSLHVKQTKNNLYNGYAHLIVLSKLDILDEKEIKDDWQIASGGSDVVNIQEVFNLNGLKKFLNCTCFDDIECHCGALDCIHV